MLGQSNIYLREADTSQRIVPHSIAQIGLAYFSTPYSVSLSYQTVFVDSLMPNNFGKNNYFIYEKMYAVLGATACQENINVSKLAWACGTAGDPQFGTRTLGMLSIKPKFPEISVGNLVDPKFTIPFSNILISSAALLSTAVYFSSYQNK